MRTIQQLASDSEGHYALKLTMFISAELMEKLTTA